MDSFTERMLKRVEERRKVLDKKLAAANLNNRITNNDRSRRNNSFDDCATNRNEVVDEEQYSEDEESDSADDKTDPRSNEKENAVPQAALRSDAVKRLRKLGALYSDDSHISISSPVQQTEQKFDAENDANPNKTNFQSAGLSKRLAALAETINQREDDLRHVSVKPQIPPNPAIANRPWRCGVKQGGNSTSVCKPAVIPINKTNIQKTMNFEKNKDVFSPTKSVVLDRSLLANLEAQGFERCESHSNLAYNYNKSDKSKPVRNRSPVKDMIENYNKIEETAVKESAVISPKKSSPTVSGTTSKKQEPEKTKQRYGSPVRMGVGKPVSDVMNKPEGNSSGNSVMPAMGVRQLLSPHSSNQGFVLQKAALFEVGSTSPNKKVQKDPAELPLSQRKALFEKNPGTAVLPKAPFALPVPVSMLQDNKKPILLSSAKINSNSSTTHLEQVSKVNGDGKNALSSVVAMFENSQKKLPETTTTTKKHVQKDIEERQKELNMLRNRWNQHKSFNDTSEFTPAALSSPSVPPAPPLPSTTYHQRTVTFSKETNRYSYSPENTISTESDDTYQQTVSPTEREYPGLKDMKKIKVSPPKPGHLYPNLSDMETESDIPPTESDVDDFFSGFSDEREKFESTTDGSSMSEDSFGKQIMEAANKSLSESTLRSLKRDLSMTSSSTNSDMSEELIGNNDLDEFLDEALDDSESEPTPPKRSRASDNYDQNLNSSHSQSFEYSRGNSNTKSCNSLPAYIVDGESQLPLTHTVSFYRKQTMSHKPVSPKHHVVHHGFIEESEESSDEDICQQQEAVERRIAELQQEVSCQQVVISQASQALNLCCSTIEFSGSTEEVEGERLLLVATQRRQAVLHEMQRLKVEGSLRPLGPDNSKLTERGDLSLSHITLPLKLDNIRAAGREEKCFHILCLVKCGPEVLSTPMKVAMPRNLHNNNKLTFPTTLTLHGLYSDFKVTIEVYGISSRSKEVLPHDIKYHISTSKKDTCRLKLTPKKSKHDDKLVRPNLQSPGGPGAVRTPKFSLMGYVVFSLREIHRNHFTLNKVPYTSILEGSIEVQLSCQMKLDIEYRGFLTMFDDISGLGAWHRRWCLLKGDKLSYWKYPDDEKKKVPMDTIDLAMCVTEEVGVVSRDICARPNTILLETSRPAQHDDEPSLILIRRGNQTIMRHLLSADTKEDRTEWCELLNKALALLRAWGKK